MTRQLAFAIAATDALLAALLVAHGVVATLRTEVAGDAIGRQHHRIHSWQMAAAIVQAIAVAVCSFVSTVSS